MFGNFHYRYSAYIKEVCAAPGIFSFSGLLFDDIAHRISVCQVAIVDDVWVNMTNTHDAIEKKLDTEFTQLNKSIKELNNNDSKLTSTLNELRQNQILTNGMNERLAINVTQLEIHVQELRKASNNISNRAVSLEKGYTQMNILMKTLQAINGAQNASHEDLQSMQDRLRDSLTAVNATLFDKVKYEDIVAFKKLFQKRQNTDTIWHQSTE